LWIRAGGHWASAARHDIGRDVLADEVRRIDRTALAIFQFALVESRFYKSMRIDWEKVQQAVQIVENGVADRVDGDGWKVYRVVAIIRIDLST